MIEKKRIEITAEASFSLTHCRNRALFTFTNRVACKGNKGLLWLIRVIVKAYGTWLWTQRDQRVVASIKQTTPLVRPLSSVQKRTRTDASSWVYLYLAMEFAVHMYTDSLRDQPRELYSCKQALWS